MHKLVPLFLLFLLAAVPAGALAWDGNWTQAETGNDVLNDPNSSEGKAWGDNSGFQMDPRHFFTPAVPNAVDVDPDELGDYSHRWNRDYSPYALARVMQDIHYENINLPKGYYTIKPGGPTAGSEKTHLASYPASPGDIQPLSQGPSGNGDAQNSSESSSNPASPSTKNSSAAQTNSGNPSGGSSKNEPYRVFVIKRLGKVVAVVPIHRMEAYNPPHRDHIPKQALAWVEYEDRHPVLKFYYKHRIYSTDFQ